MGKSKDTNKDTNKDSGDYIIKPSSQAASMDSAKWPLLLKVGFLLFSFHFILFHFIR